MIQFMDNTAQDNVTTFSFEMKDWDEPMPDKQLLEQVRFHAIRVLNLVATTNQELTDEDIASIKVYNKYCGRFGLPPVEIDC